MSVGLILFLILVNGLFAMSEIAVVSSRRARLQRLAKSGRPGAAPALHLHDEPSHFLSTIQVGITTVGILSGAVGETALARPLSAWLSRFPLLAPYSEGVAFALVIIVVTYLSVVVGELVPKRLALLGPEKIALFVSRPMLLLSRAASPVVRLLSFSSSFLLRLLRAERSSEPPVTDEEIRALMAQGAEAGVFHASEQDLVSNILRLDRLSVAAIMTHRSDIYFIDLDDPEEENRRKVADSPHSRIVVCRGGLDNILGILQKGDLLRKALWGEKIDFSESLRPATYVSDFAPTTQLMESLRKARSHTALIIDEYGDLQGMVTLNDMLAAIIEDIPFIDKEREPEIVEREDGSWLVDGRVTMERFREFFALAEFSDEEAGLYNTVGGFLMTRLGRIPTRGDIFKSSGVRFEIVDMDGQRIDQVLVSRLPEGGLRDQRSR